MALGADEIAHALDLFSGLGALTTRKMMGGACLYHDGVIFAIARSDGEILIKGAGAFIDELDAMGCTRWIHTRADGRTQTMPYWTLPPAAQDDPEAASDLARRALGHL